MAKVVRQTFIKYIGLECRENLANNKRIYPKRRRQQSQNHQKSHQTLSTCYTFSVLQMLIKCSSPFGSLALSLCFVPSSRFLLKAPHNSFCTNILLYDFLQFFCNTLVAYFWDFYTANFFVVYPTKKRSLKTAHKGKVFGHRVCNLKSLKKAMRGCMYTDQISRKKYLGKFTSQSCSLNVRRER